ncbi:replication initiator [Nocardia sp. NPDC058499]|uniref:replication initiator n=1 Tax=Nocardia sp. NPDC058499 TaxID=3346530 RepID=UPI003667575B
MDVVTSTDESGVPARQTAAARRSLPDFRDVAEATAEKVGVCTRPLIMKVFDPVAGRNNYVGVPCKATLESVCKPCATRNRFLRITQCREGWHMETEPEVEPQEPTETQIDLLTARSDLFGTYQQAKQDGDAEMMAAVRDVVAELDDEMKESGFRGRLPDLDRESKERRKRSTRRRQDAPNLPRRKVSKHTIGQQFAGKFRPSMFVTLTLPSYGQVQSDGSPRTAGTYDYQRAARDIVFFAQLVDRWIQNLRRVVGYNVQYWGTVEPQRRGAPHLHVALRGAISHKIIQQVTAATYFQVWWPRFDPEDEIYPADVVPVWDPQQTTFVDPDSGAALLGFDDAIDVLGGMDEWAPAHVTRFGEQVDSKGILGGTEEATRHIGYMTKYLTKSINEVLEPETQRAADHYERLHAELQHIPCSKNCPVWLRFGIVPLGATEKTVPGRCRGRCHRRDLLGIPGKRTPNSRQWSGKTLPDHQADRVNFVRQLLAEYGIEKPDNPNLRYSLVKPGDKNCPPRDHIIMASIVQRIAWRAEYNRALLDAGPPDELGISAIPEAA